MNRQWYCSPRFGLFAFLATNGRPGKRHKIGHTESVIGEVEQGQVQDRATAEQYLERQQLWINTLKLSSGDLSDLIINHNTA